MSKDPFQALVDEITLIRGEVATLQRTSLNRDEAKALSDEIAKGLHQMAQTGPAVLRAIETRLATTVAEIRAGAVSAAETAASGAIGKSHAEVLRAAQSFSEAAGEARSAAWRAFGGFWVWLVSMLALGGLSGALASQWITHRGDAAQFRRFPGVYCSDAGGQTVKQKDGSSFCAIWIDPPKKAGD